MLFLNIESDTETKKKKKNHFYFHSTFAFSVTIFKWAVHMISMVKLIQANFSTAIL